MPPKSPKPAPRLITPAEPHYRPSRLTVTYLALLAVPVVLWLLYALFRPVPEKIVPPPAEITAPAPTADTTAPPASTPPAPAETVLSAEERVAAAVAAAKQQAAPPVVPSSASVDLAAVLHYSEARENPLDYFPRAESTWGDILNPRGIIPANGYAVWYLDTGHSRQPGIGDDGRPRNPQPQGPELIPAFTPQPQHVVAREKIGSISVDYGWNELHGIPSRQFAAYWVGRIRIPQRSLYSIKNDMGWARVRVILDGYILIDGEKGKYISLELDSGDHLLEVEYVNAWHTTKFRLDIVPAPILSNSR